MSLRAACVVVAMVAASCAAAQSESGNSAEEAGRINARLAMETFIRQHGDQIDGVWAAWDEPAIGALLAQQSDAPDAKMVIAGIDGNPQAVDLIKQCSNLVATVRQDFPGIARAAVTEIGNVIDGKPVSKQEIFVEATVIDRKSLGVTCGQ